MCEISNEEAKRALFKGFSVIYLMPYLVLRPIPYGSVSKIIIHRLFILLTSFSHTIYFWFHGEHRPFSSKAFVSLDSRLLLSREKKAIFPSSLLL